MTWRKECQGLLQTIGGKGMQQGGNGDSIISSSQLTLAASGEFEATELWTIQNMEQIELRSSPTNSSWLVVWNIFFHILGILIPTDSYFAEGSKPPTNSSIFARFAQEEWEQKPPFFSNSSMRSLATIPKSFSDQLRVGCFHGKSLWIWMRTGATPLLGNLHLSKYLNINIFLLVLSREWMGMGEWDDY